MSAHSLGIVFHGLTGAVGLVVGLHLLRIGRTVEPDRVPCGACGFDVRASLGEQRTCPRCRADLGQVGARATGAQRQRLLFVASGCLLYAGLGAFSMLVRFRAVNRLLDPVVFVSLPVTCLVMLGAAIALVWGIRLLRTVDGVGPDRAACGACGYDVRASLGHSPVCPECGAEFACVGVRLRGRRRRTRLIVAWSIIGGGAIAAGVGGLQLFADLVRPIDF